MDEDLQSCDQWTKAQDMQARLLQQGMHITYPPPHHIRPVAIFCPLTHTSTQVRDDDVKTLLAHLDEDMRLEDGFPCSHRAMCQYVLEWTDVDGNPVRVTWAAVHDR